MRLRLFVLLAAVAASSTCWGQGEPIRSPIHVGWETTCYPLGTVAPGSAVAADRRKETVVSYAIDRFWILMPFWNADAKLVLSRPYERGSLPNNIFEFEDQSLESVSGFTGIPEEGLRRPWSTYLPFGWSVVISIFAVRKVFFRPLSPRRRFKKIWAEPRYRAALAVMFGDDALVDRDCPFPIYLAEQPPDLRVVFREILPALEEDGLSRFTAEGDLVFAAGYLVDEGQIVISAPDERPATGPGGGPSTADEAVLPDSTWKHDGLVD